MSEHARRISRISSLVRASLFFFIAFGSLTFSLNLLLLISTSLNSRKFFTAFTLLRKVIDDNGLLKIGSRRYEANSDKMLYGLYLPSIMFIIRLSRSKS